MDKERLKRLFHRESRNPDILKEAEEVLTKAQKSETISFGDLDRLTQGYIMTAAISPVLVILGGAGVVAGGALHIPEMTRIASLVLGVGAAGVIIALAPMVYGDGWVATSRDLNKR